MVAAARWLLLRPQNAVLGLVVLLILPASSVTGGTVLVLLTLAQGVKLALLQAGSAAATVLLVSLLVGAPVDWMTLSIVGGWIPAMVLAAMLLTMRSLTLVLQVSVIIAIAALIGFAIVVTDAAAFWEPYVVSMKQVLNAGGMDLNADFLTPDVVTVSVVLAFWLLNTTALCLGNGLYHLLPVEKADFGRFRDMNFGRVIALATAVISMIGLVVDWSWALNAASVLFAVFMLQGLAILHWLKAAGILPAGALISIYVLLPLLQSLLFVVLALVGYVDAWMGIRRRLRKQ